MSRRPRRSGCSPVLGDSLTAEQYPTSTRPTRRRPLSSCRRTRQRGADLPVQPADEQRPPPRARLNVDAGSTRSDQLSNEPGQKNIPCTYRINPGGSAAVWQGPYVTHGSKADAHVPEALVSSLHRAARVEDAVHGFIEPRLRQRGWRDTIVPYTGYGTPSWVRVMARLLLRRPEQQPEGVRAVRGWRSFATLPVTAEIVVIDVGDRQHEVRTDRGGYIDVVVEAGLEPGWRSVRLHRVGAEPVEAPVRILAPDVRFGVVSDIDDTVMVTALPRPFLAAWNTFVLDEYARSPGTRNGGVVRATGDGAPGCPVFYLSTGAWNVAPALTRFLSRNLYPPGPLLLTDWGPTPDRLFRQRAGAQAGDARTACAGVPGHPLAAHRRRRAARPGDLRQLRRVTSRQRRRGGHPAAVSDAIGARRWSPDHRRRFHFSGSARAAVDVRSRWRRAGPPAERNRFALVRLTQGSRDRSPREHSDHGDAQWQARPPLRQPRR